MLHLRLVFKTVLCRMLPYGQSLLPQEKQGSKARHARPGGVGSKQCCYSYTITMGLEVVTRNCCYVYATANPVISALLHRMARRDPAAARPLLRQPLPNLS